jgi:carboxypeptidase Q
MKNALVLLCFAFSSAAQDKLDLEVVHRIKQEAFVHSKVMDHLFFLTDVNGPRLTNSPGYKTATTWAMTRLGEWGLSQPRLEKWGTFGRGWSFSRASVHLLAPTTATLEAAPKAWSGGTAGPVAGDVLYAPVFSKKDADVFNDLTELTRHLDKYMQKFRGALKGKVVLVSEARDFKAPSKEAPTPRYDDAKLGDLGKASEPMALPEYEVPLQRLPADDKKRAALFNLAPPSVIEDYYLRRRRITAKLIEFYRSEGAVAVLNTDDRGDGGLIFTEGLGSWELNAPSSVPTLALAPESYNRLARLVERRVPTKVEVDLRVQFDDSTADAFNVVAEIVGTKKKDEVVMLGAHLDSWHSATGATDNAAGVAVMMEAMRILKALKLPLERTVRLALWSGEEQGLLGSKGYVQNHFGNPATMQLKPEHAKLAAYFNVDNGGGKIRGIYLQQNDMVKPVFEAWLGPFRDLGAGSISPRDTGGTDHQSFDAVGLPGFQFIQDPQDYMSRTHHSAVDTIDHIDPADVMQASAIVAAFAYAAANRPQMLPRKPLPQGPPQQTK